jgi:tripartite-type tricarboxylate transporter receptor subunit TctC
MRTLSVAAIAIAAAAAVVYSGQGQAQGAPYPARPVKVVVVMGPGGSNDIVARLFSQKLTEALKQPFVVENRAGGGGVVGTEYVARSAPDGHTLLVGNTGNIGIHPSLFRKLPYDTQRDFVPISVLVATPSVLVVHPSVPAQTVSDLVAFAKSSPGKLNYASPGTGTSFHLSAELFKARTGTQMTHIAYKGSSPALVDLVAGQVQLMFANVPEVMPHINAGKIRALASTGSKRVALAPNVPTMQEAGFPNAESVSWFVMMAPKGTPREVVAMLHTEIVRIAAQPDVQQRLAELGCLPVANAPAEAESYIRGEIAKWAKAVKESGATAD